MLKTLLKAVGLLACVAWFSLASAANMGGINVMSALGHPLKAEISLSELGKNDKTTLVAKLASVNDFKSAGIDYPYSLPKLTFSVDTRANGEVFIRLTSTQPVNEPFVSLVVELSWPSGKMLREFTFLLDPAGFVAEQPKVAEVKPVEPMVPAVEPMPVAVPVPAAEAPVAPEVTALPPEPAAELSDMAKAELAAAETAKAAPAEPAPKAPAESDMAKAESVAAELAPAEQVLAEHGKPAPAEPVKVEPLAPTPQVSEAARASILIEKGDTLGKIADDIKPVDVSLERMLVAMYRANAQKFDGKNMNRIRAGKILRMPDASEIAKVTQAAAVREIRAQVADWQEYRQKLAAAQSAAPEQEPKQESAGKISTAVAEKAPVVKESAKEVLRLSKGEALGDKAIAGGAGKQEKQAAKADDATAMSKQAQEEQKKIAKLEGISKDVNKLVELKAQPAAPVAANEAQKPAASAPLATAKKPLAASAVPAAAPASDEFDIMATLEGMLGDPIALGVVAAVLLGLGGLAYMKVRRGKGGQKKTTKKNEEVGATTGSWRTPVAPSPDTGDFTQQFQAPTPAAVAAPMSVAAAMDDVDPLSEADLFLNFGRDVQAEEILKDALTKTPGNLQIKLKLLSIYSTRKDVKSFSRYAQEIKDSGDTAAWERAAVMGREVDPGNPNYGDAKGEVRNRERPPAEVDFDLGLGKPAAPASQMAAKDFTMDFDLTGSQPSMSEASIDVSAPFAQASAPAQPARAADVDATSILSRADVQAAEAASPMDFDISGILPGEAKKVAEATTMDFDLSGSNLELPRDNIQSNMMDFDLSGSNLEMPSASQKPAAAEVDSSTMNFNDLIFEIPTSQPKPAEEKPKASADEGLAFTIDFPTSSTTEPAPSKSDTSSKLDIDFGSININLDEDLSSQPGGEGKDEHWHEVATKLDLAKAYQEMGDADGAREILEEVIRDGDTMQRESAEKLLQQIAA